MKVYLLFNNKLLPLKYFNYVSKKNNLVCIKKKQFDYVSKKAICIHVLNYKHMLTITFAIALLSFGIRGREVKIKKITEHEKKKTVFEFENCPQIKCDKEFSIFDFADKKRGIGAMKQFKTINIQLEGCKDHIPYSFSVPVVKNISNFDDINFEIEEKSDLLINLKYLTKEFSKANWSSFHYYVDHINAECNIAPSSSQPNAVLDIKWTLEGMIQKKDGKDFYPDPSWGDLNICQIMEGKAPENTNKMVI